MESEKGLKKVLALAGIAALIALPFVVFSKKRRGDNKDETFIATDDSNIFAAELEV